MLTDNSTNSYAIFTYQCDLINWSGVNTIYAKIGVSFGGVDETIHPLSGNASANQIDCTNNATGYVNLVYDLNPSRTISVEFSSTVEIQMETVSVITSPAVVNMGPVKSILSPQAPSTQTVAIISSDSTTSFSTSSTLLSPCEFADLCGCQSDTIHFFNSFVLNPPFPNTLVFFVTNFPGLIVHNSFLASWKMLRYTTPGVAPVGSYKKFIGVGWYYG